MNTILISGNGKGNPAIRLWWIYEILGAGISAVLLYFFSTRFSGRSIGNFEISDILLWLGIALCFIFIISAVLAHRRIQKTEINVYENEVEGKGFGKYISFGDFRLFKFRIASDQITGVDISKSSIIIHTSNAAYRIYVANPSEIKNTIKNKCNT